MQSRRLPKLRRSLAWVATLFALPALISTVTAQDAPPPSQRSSPFERTPGDPPSTPTPIPQTSFAPAPSVVLPESDRQREPQQSAGGIDGEELSLEIQNEPDGAYVTFTELLRVIRQVDSGAQARWDGLLGVFRIESSGHSLQVLSNQPVVVVDGRTAPVNKPIDVRGGVALVPASSINTIFQALDFDFALPESLGGRTPSASDSDGESRAAETAISQRRPRPSMLSAQDALLPEVGGTAITQLDIPQVDASVAGLTWDELTDYAHPRAPQRMTIVYDAPFHTLADALGRVAKRTGLPEVSLIQVESRRDDPALLTRVSQSRPEILLDLKASGAEGQRNFEVWTVHEALWTPPAQARPEQRVRLVQELYVVHQFHNLALGSVLRAELAKSFPDGTVRHELSPCYLLRRVDAPSAAVVIPEELARGNDRELERVARALAGGFAGYYRGVRSATNL